MTADSHDVRYDTIIIGGGPAGLTAAVYAARQGLATAVVYGSIGGQLMWAHQVENFIGFQLISGPDLVERFKEHVQSFEVDCFEGKLVNAIVAAEHGFDVFTREGDSVAGRTVIIATGKAPNRLAIVQRWRATSEKKFETLKRSRITSRPFARAIVNAAPLALM